MIVAVHTDDFLSYVLIGFHVDTVAGDIDRKFIAVKFGCEVKTCKDADDVLIGNRDSEDAVNPCNAYRELSGLNGVACINVERCLGYLAAAELFDEVQGTLHCHDCRVLIDTLGESH